MAGRIADHCQHDHCPHGGSADADNYNARVMQTERRAA